MSTLYEQLKAYGASDYYGFHMPGHKRNPRLMEGLPCEIDITEIEGFDDLHHPEGILKNAQEEAAGVWHADETFFLVNGSTVGILSALTGLLEEGDHVLLARNAHQSAYHAVELGKFVPVYLYPEIDPETDLACGITAQAVEEALTADPKIKAVLIVSPTYEGTVSEVGRIADAAHEKGVPLVVDEAHGAHFGFHPYFPENANELGADVVIHSLHKTLPALTQTALLHLNGERINRKRIVRALHMLQTSSPSYVLMASIDACTQRLKEDKDALFDPYVALLKGLRTRLGELDHLKLTSTGVSDPSKLVLSVKEAGISSLELYHTLLEEYHLQMEMAAGSYCLAMTSVGDTAEGFRRLEEALFAIDGSLSGRRETKSAPAFTSGPAPEMVCTSWEMRRQADAHPDKVKERPWEESVGSISAEYAYLYPPGSPLLVPGERISARTAETAAAYEKAGFSLKGIAESGGIEVFEDG